MLVEMHRRLNQSKCAKLWRVIFDVIAAVIILVNQGMQSAHAYIMNSYICFMPSSESDRANVIEIDDM